MTDPREVLSALIDGETVDPDLVAEVLEAPGNRALLVDFVRLRQAVHVDDRAAAEWRPDYAAAAGRPTARRRGSWARAAAVLTLLTAGAFGGVWAQGVLTRERPPEPTRMVQLELVEPR